MGIPQLIQALNSDSIQVLSSWCFFFLFFLGHSMYIFIYILTNQFFYFCMITLSDPGFKDAEKYDFAQQEKEKVIMSH